MPTHFIRDFKNNTIADIDERDGGKDFGSVISIGIYSLHLLKTPTSKRVEFVKDFDALQELRGEYWETRACKEETVGEFLKRRCSEVAEKWDFKYVID